MKCLQLWAFLDNCLAMGKVKVNEHSKLFAFFNSRCLAYASMFCFIKFLSLWPTCGVQLSFIFTPAGWSY